MNRTAVSLIFVLSSALPGTVFQGAFPHQTAPAAWAGHWKLDRAASHLLGAVVTIDRLPHSYRFDLGGLTLQVGDDGNDYPTTPERTTSFTQTGERRWLRVHKLRGKTLDTTIFTLAPDGQSFLIHTVAVEDGGVRHVSEETFRREGPGEGIAGTWRSTRVGVNTAETIDVTPTGPHALRFAYSDQQMWFVTAMDGAAVAYHGARAVESLRVTVARVSPALLRYTDLVNGRPYMQGTYRLSSDGQHLTEASWHVTSPQAKEEAVYTRQGSR